jgi:hypothetical protein
MDYRKWIIIGCVVAGVVLVVTLIAVKNRSEGTRPTPRVPELVGQPVPATTFEIDFGKRYELHCSPAGAQSEVVLHRCKIVGSTGPTQHHTVPSPYAELYGQGLYYGRWLVLELPDGRRAYVPPESIHLIEESPEAQ